MASVLFIASNRIGDAVLATGALAFARDQLGGAPAVTIAAGPLAAPLYRATPGLAALHEVVKVKSRAFAHWNALRAAVRGQRFDLAVDLRGTLVTYLLPARRRIVHRKSSLIRHKILDLTATMRAPAPLDPVLHLDEAALAAAAAFAPDPAPLLALGPGTNFIGKQWPAERFALAALRLLGPGGALAGGQAALLGGPADAPILAEIAATLAEAGVRAHQSAGALDLLACAGVLRRAVLFIGNDSGMMHLAAAAGAPTLGLFGPSDERIYGPWGPRTRALRGRPYAEIMALGYMPDIHHSLMGEITVDAVADAAEQLLAGGGLV